MKEEPEKIVIKDEVVLLDISMFILNFLSSDRINENYQSDNVILEVPSALVNMIWTARANDKSEIKMNRNILFDLIYAHLIGFQNNPNHKNSKDPRVIHLLESINNNLQGLAQTAYNRILYEFAPLIDGATKQATKEMPSNGDQEKLKSLPIRRYEAELSIENYELFTLQNSYKKELGLDVHPLYDLYFLQVYHAQNIGLEASPVKKRKILAMGRQTYTAIKSWKKGIDEKWEENKYGGSDERLVKNIIGKYAADEWDTLLLDLVLDLTFFYFVPGGGVALIVASNLIIPPALDIATEATGQPIRKIILALFGGGALIYFCISATIRVGGYLSSIPTTTPSPSQTPQNLPLLPASTIAIDTLTSIPTNIIPFSFITETPIFTSTLTTSNLDYCLYVAQPSDTLQSVAAWFSVSENEIRNSDKLVNWGAFAVHQVIRVNAPCCRPNGNNGFSYFVQPGDNVFRLALNYATSVDKIVSANNLDDLHYIQAGQMLCIPNP